MTTPVPTLAAIDRDRFEEEVVPAGRPVVLRGIAAGWPVAAAARKGDEALARYLLERASPAPVKAWIADPAVGGRFGYSDDLAGFNHQRGALPLAKLLDLLLAMRDEADVPAVYAGGVPVAEHLPGLAPDLPMPLLAADTERLVSLWIGNRTRVAAHWDLPQNLACVVAGRRRFTLFPPEQVANLSVGPLDFTLAGQPTSLVDVATADPDPPLAEALGHALVAELRPGDALYVPSLWWHAVDALDPVGMMVNFWWRDGPAAARPTPLATLFHARLTLRDLPPNERRAWRALFDHYIFGDDDPMAHLPEAARGVFGPLTPEREARLLAILREMLG